MGHENWEAEKWLGHEVERNLKLKNNELFSKKAAWLLTQSKDQTQINQKSLLFSNSRKHTAREEIRNDG